MKPCRTCGDSKPESDFYVYRKRWKGGFRESLRPNCRTCENKIAYQDQLENERLSKYQIRGWGRLIAETLAHPPLAHDRRNKGDALDQH